jgi:hypothetical protein
VLDMPKHFSPAQANAALPLVRQIVNDVVAHHGRLAELVIAYQKKKRETGTSQIALNEAKRELAQVSTQRDDCVGELVDLGVQLKDAGQGLVDFPGELDGEPVLFCWKLGEDRVEYFHTETEGFAGRKLIPVPEHVA